MFDFVLERPYLIVILVVFILLTLFVCVKAGQASAKRSKANGALIKKLKEENELRHEFASLTPELVQKSQPDRLFKGVALNLQKKISDAADMESEFKKLSQEQKELYALSFVVEDGGEKLSEFFKVNGQPLTGASLNAVNHLFAGEAAQIFKAEYDAFDPDNETESLIPERIAELDKKFARLLPAEKICAEAGKLICENIEKFM